MNSHGAVDAASGMPCGSISYASCPTPSGGPSYDLPYLSFPCARHPLLLLPFRLSFHLPSHLSPILPFRKCTSSLMLYLFPFPLPSFAPDFRKVDLPGEYPIRRCVVSRQCQPYKLSEVTV